MSGNKFISNVLEQTIETTGAKWATVGLLLSMAGYCGANVYQLFNQWHKSSSTTFEASHYFAGLLYAFGTVLFGMASYAAFQNR